MITFAGGRASWTIRVAAAVALAAAIAAAGAPRAEAGTYAVKFCAEGVTANEDKGPFERSGNETVYALTNNCGGFNGLRVSHNAGNQGTQDVEGRWLAQRPEGITIAQIAYKASGAEKSGGYTAQVIGDKDADTQLDILNGGSQLSGDFADFTATGDVRRFGVRLICQTDGGACTTNPSGPEAKLKNVTYTVQDPAPPAINLTGGTLFEAPVQTGSQTISFEASDAGSGVHQIVAIVNGEVTATSRGSCSLGAGFGLAFKPCTPTLAGAVTVDTAKAPFWNGENKVQICADDYATAGAPSRTCSPAQTVRVLNGCAANGAPTNVGQTLKLEWPGKQNAAIQNRQGRARTAVASLFGPAGAPLAGAAVCLSRSIPDGSPQERLVEPGAITGADGRIGVKVRGASSRTVYATYWTGPETVLTSAVEMRVAPRIRLEVKPKGKIERGKQMRIVAILRGKWKADRRVCFYAEKPGNDRVGCDRSGTGGRARFGYRPDRLGKTYFYAKVPNQRGYPYTNKRSKKKSVKISK
jgi:hypothetical protein